MHLFLSNNTMVRIFTYSVCIICSILLFGSCSHSAQTDKLLAQVDSIIYSHRDSAVYLLDKIADHNMSERQQADYWRLRITSHIVQGKSTVEDSMIISALNYYKKHNMQKELMETYRLVLNHLSWKNDTLNYTRYYTEAFELAQQTHNSIATYNLLRTTAGKLYGINDYKQAYLYYTKAFEYDSTSSSTCYMAALTYSMIKNNDTIDYWMQKAIDLARQNNDTARLCHYYRNYADIQIASKKYNKALVNIKHMEAYDTDSPYTAPYMKAEIFLQQHQLDSAQYYLDQTLETYTGSDKDRSFGFTKKGLTFFQNIITYAKGGTFDFTLIGQHTDSLHFNEIDRIKIYEEQVVTKQKLSEQNQLLIIKKQRIQLILLSTLFLTLVVVAVIYLYAKRKRDRLYQMEEKMESLQKLMGDVSDNFKTSREHSAYFKKVLLQQLGLIRFTASNPTNPHQDMLRLMAKLTNEEIPVDSLIIWDDLYALIDSLYDHFYTQMKSKWESALTEKEMQLCCLLCADFTTKEISTITQQSIRTIYQRKTTIRLKLNMQAGEDIVEYIGRLSSDIPEA